MYMRCDTILKHRKADITLQTLMITSLILKEHGNWELNNTAVVLLLS